MQDYDIKLAPGEVRVINVQADYIYYRAGSAGGADAAIEFSRRSGGERVFLYPGQSYRLPPGAAYGSEWALRNLKGEATIIGAILMGEGNFQDNRISGSVEVIDGGKARTMANTAFMMLAYSAANPAAYAMNQLHNPANSGKNLIVEQVICSTAGIGAGGIYGRFNTAPLAGAAVRPGVSKRSGVSPSAGQVQSLQTTPIPATAGDNFVALDKTNKAIKFSEPLCLTPGYGLFFFNLTVNEDLSTSFEWFEESA